MTKAKIFRFIVSNWSSHAFEDDKKKSSYRAAQDELDTPEDIEATINHFAACHLVKDVKISSVESHHHNNGRGNTVELYYTVLYEG